MPPPKVMTVVSALVPVDKEQHLVEGYRRLVAGAKPDGLLRTELLQGRDGRWVVQTLWRDLATVVALRQSGQPPAVLALLDSLQLEHSHEALTVQEEYAG